MQSFHNGRSLLLILLLSKQLSRL